MLKKDHQLIMPFVKEPWKKFTFGQIKKLSKKTSESYVYDGLNNFVKEEILKKERVGNIFLYSLNLRKLKTQVFAGFVAEYLAWKTKHIHLKDLEIISAKIPTAFYTFLITGSYARNQQTEKSDIDAVIIVDDCVETNKIYATLRLTCELNIPPVHLYVFKKSEFKEMLINNEPNYGKEITKNNIILCGGREYYEIMNEATQNGFNEEKLH